LEQISSEKENLRLLQNLLSAVSLFPQLGQTLEFPDEESLKAYLKEARERREAEQQRVRELRRK